MYPIPDNHLFVDSNHKFYTQKGDETAYTIVCGATAKTWYEALSEENLPEDDEYTPIPSKNGHKMHLEKGFLKRNGAFVNSHRIEGKTLAQWKKLLRNRTAEKPEGNWKKGTNPRFQLEANTDMLFDTEENRVYKKSEWTRKYTPMHIGFQYKDREIIWPIKDPVEHFWFRTDDNLFELNPITKQTWCRQTGKYKKLKEIDFIMTLARKCGVLPLHCSRPEKLIVFFEDEQIIELDKKSAQGNIWQKWYEEEFKLDENGEKILNKDGQYRVISSFRPVRLSGYLIKNGEVINPSLIRFTLGSVQLDFYPRKKINEQLNEIEHDLNMITMMNKELGNG